MTQKRNVNEQLGNVVWVYFIRVVKNHDVYNKFKKSFNRVSERSRDSEDNPLGKFNDYKEMLERLERFADRESSMRFRSNNSKMTQEMYYNKITIMINHLLHFFLENGGVEPSKLGQFGQEIFDLSCYSLFKEQYIRDMERMEKEVPIPRNENEKMLIAKYMKHKSQGFTGSYDDFLSLMFNNNQQLIDSVLMGTNLNHHDEENMEIREMNDFNEFLRHCTFESR